MVLICISLITNEIEYLLSNLWTVSISLSVEILNALGEVGIICPFAHWCIGVLYICWVFPGGLDG